MRIGSTVRYSRLVPTSLISVREGGLASSPLTLQEFFFFLFFFFFFSFSFFFPFLFFSFLFSFFSFLVVVGGGGEEVTVDVFYQSSATELVE